MLRSDLIEASISMWASPIVLILKKDCSLQLCVDYRKLNAVTSPDPFPMPRLDELIDGLTSDAYIACNLRLDQWIQAGYGGEELKRKDAICHPL